MAATPRQMGLRLRALLYCVFDKEEGPIVCCSDPPHAIDREQAKLGRYLLPEGFVKGRVVSVVLDDNVIIGAPVYIEDTRYARNCFQFNICAIISSNIDMEPYRDLAQHLATAFQSLEVEFNFLSGPEELSRTSHVESVRSVLAELRHQLRESGECFVRVDHSHCISFRVWHYSPLLAAEPKLTEVPIPLVDLKQLVAPSRGSVPMPSGSTLLPYEPDLALIELVRFIDGTHTVEEIVNESCLERDVVLKCLQHLVHFGLVATIDAINLRSRYRLTPEFHSVFDRLDVAAEVVRYVTAGRHHYDDDDDRRSTFMDVIQGLYAQIDGWNNQTLEKFQIDHAGELQEAQISLRHFITFGLLRGFLEACPPVEEVSLEMDAAQPSWTTSQKRQEARGRTEEISDTDALKRMKKLLAPEARDAAPSWALPPVGEAPTSPQQLDGSD